MECPYRLFINLICRLRKVEIHPSKQRPHKRCGKSRERSRNKRHNKARSGEYANYNSNNSAGFDRTFEKSEYSEHEHKNAERTGQYSFKVKLNKVFESEDNGSYSEGNKYNAYEHFSKTSLFSHSFLQKIRILFSFRYKT